jgi:hypothetical protein
MYSKGISWIDDCRIPFVDEKDKEKNTEGLSRFNDYRGKRIDLGYGFSGGDSYEINTQGRFPANLLVSDDMLNDGVITKTTASKGHIRKGNVIGDNRTPVAAGLFGDGNWIEGTNINDKGTNSRYYDIDKWFNNLIDV